jgi:hypothetical protein
LARLPEQRPEKIQCADVVRLPSENLAAYRFGVGELARLLKIDRLLQRILRGN